MNKPTHGNTICLVAGEASGDVHGAHLMAALKPLLGDPRQESTRFWGLGGAHMVAEGLETLAPLEDLAVMGLEDVLQAYPNISTLFRVMERQLKKRMPKALILIDYPGFNLKLAQIAKALGIAVFYHIPPKVWAHGAGRTRILHETCRLVSCILPFEIEFLRARGVNAHFVGNPLYDAICSYEKSHPKPPQQSTDFTVALCPGSRVHEVNALLPLFLSALGLLRKRLPQKEIRALLPIPKGFNAKMIHEHIQASNEHVTTINGGMYEVLNTADYAWVASGTATLETAFFGVPLCAVYRVGALTAWAARRLLKVKWVSLVNLCAQTELIPEFLQEQATPENLVTHSLCFSQGRDNPAYTALQNRLRALGAKFPHGSAATAAHLIVEHL